MRLPGPYPMKFEFCKEELSCFGKFELSLIPNGIHKKSFANDKQ